MLENDNDLACLCFAALDGKDDGAVRLNAGPSELPLLLSVIPLLLLVPLSEADIDALPMESGEVGIV